MGSCAVVPRELSFLATQLPFCATSVTGLSGDLASMFLILQQPLGSCTELKNIEHVQLETHESEAGPEIEFLGIAIRYLKDYPEVVSEAASLQSCHVDFAGRCTS